MSRGRRYRILSTLGQGSYGTVYLAELQGAGGFVRQVAVKVLTLGAGASAEQARQLRDEARVLGLIRHRAVVAVDSLSRLDDGWAVVMEYVPGIDASELLAGEPAPVSVILEIVEEVASALHAAYAEPAPIRGAPLELVHRDIKPANIRITAQGEVKVLDFGIALLPGSSGAPAGSRRYMSPERHLGRDGPEGDVYALGLVAAELLAGARSPAAPLVHGAQPTLAHEAWMSVVTEAARAGARASSPEVPDDRIDPVLELVRRCLSWDPAARPSARDVVQRCRALREHLAAPTLRTWAETAVPTLQAGADHQRDLTRPPDLLLDGTATASAPMPVGRNRRRWSTVAVGVSVGFISAVVGFSFLWSTRTPATSASASASPSPTEVATTTWAVREGAPLTTPPEVAPAPVVVPPTSAPTEPPTTEAPSAGVLAVEGDADEVRLERRGRSYAPGSVPAGRYHLVARFDQESLPFGDVEVRGGKTTRVRCARAMMVCKEVP